jgi:tetratricopeptide (TPR) repeat protein
MACAACSRPHSNTIQRVALLPLENLSGDTALDWIASAAPRVVNGQLMGGTAATLPIEVAAVRDAYAAGAGKLVHGYFEKRGQDLHFEFAIEDLQTHKMLQTVSTDGAALAVFDRLAREIDTAAHPFSSANADAISAWIRGDYENAVRLDPDFGSAWFSWVQTRSAAGDAAQAAEIAQRALSRTTLKSPVDRARLELVSATLRHDDPARQQAVASLARLMPNDPGLLSQLASQEMNARRFAQAAQYYQDILRLEPEQTELWNQLGYAQAFAGDLEAARKSFERYGSDPEHAANALDSSGEAFFSRGKFEEAEKYFLQAHAKSSALLSGADLLKAAYARWLQGDLPGADKHFAEYLAFRRQQNDPLLEWRQAVWEYSTGRADTALARLAKIEGSNPAGAVARSQLGVWKDLSKLPADPASLKTLYERTPPGLDGVTRVLYARALVRNGQKDEARKVLELWPLPGLDSDPLLQSLLFPQFLELKRQVN